MNPEAQQHWEKIYRTKAPNEVSWTQEVPVLSLDFIRRSGLPKTARIIDVGGGDSKLVDHLLLEGYTNITVLDISAAAIDRAKSRLGAAAENVKWIVSDILDFRPLEKYDCWHDRAAFHFQTSQEKIDVYLNIVRKAAKGIVIVGTFSTEGPKKCSGLDVKQYNEASMKTTFEANEFKNIECRREDHITPAEAVQNFVFCSFINLAQQQAA